jgi:hypothetical protein
MTKFTTSAGKKKCFIILIDGKSGCQKPSQKILIAVKKIVFEYLPFYRPCPSAGGFPGNQYLLRRPLFLYADAGVRTDYGKLFRTFFH